MRDSSHNHFSLLFPQNPRYRDCIYKHTTLNLIEDRGEGDVTTNVLLQKEVHVKASIIAQQRGIFAGRMEVEYFLVGGPKKFRPGMGKFQVQFLKKDGETIEKGETLCYLSGRTRDLFLIERTVLNLLCHLSGIATRTHHIVMQVKKVNKNVLIAATRKTLWGLLDKRAVALGGGATHRLGLSDAIILKDNHLDLFGRDIKGVIFRCLRGSKKMTQPEFYFLEIEVDTPREAVAAAGIIKQLREKRVLVCPCFIMFDNFSLHQAKAAIHQLQKMHLRSRVGIELSGGITKENVVSFAKTGADVLSMGTLTQDCKSLHMNLQIC